MNREMGITDGDGDINNITLMETFIRYDNSTESIVTESDCGDVTATDGDLCEYGYGLIKCILQILSL